MRNKIFFMLAVIMTCSLCACGKQTTGTMTNTGDGTKQMVASESNSEQTVSSENSTEQTVTEEPSDNEISDMNSETEIFENKDHWPDVAELVNLKGDETTVYLLADGRYMDRINAIYMFDGKDTWTDEAGVEWNEVVK